jgi:hypothetical protein
MPPTGRASAQPDRERVVAKACRGMDEARTCCQGKGPIEAALMRRFKFCDPPIPLPKLYVLAINKSLGLFFGGLIVGAKDVDAILYVPVRA